MTQAELLSTNPDIQELPPRILADLIIDGSLRAETLEWHLRNNTRVLILSGFGLSNGRRNRG